MNRLTHQISERRRKKSCQGGGKKGGGGQGHFLFHRSSFLSSPASVYCTNLDFIIISTNSQFPKNKIQHIKLHGANMIRATSARYFSANVSDGWSRSSQGSFSAERANEKSSWSTVCDRSVPQNHVISVASLSQSFSYTWSEPAAAFWRLLLVHVRRRCLGDSPQVDRSGLVLKYRSQGTVVHRRRCLCCYCHYYYYQLAPPQPNLFILAKSFFGALNWSPQFGGPKNKQTNKKTTTCPSLSYKW